MEGHGSPEGLIQESKHHQSIARQRGGGLDEE